MQLILTLALQINWGSNQLFWIYIFHKKKFFFHLKDNPQYTYAYQVAAEDEQTYIAHQEQRDGDDVSISRKN